MAALGSQSIASSYEQLLHVDADGGGNGTTHVSVKDGDNGTTFGFTIASDALMMSSTNRLEFGDNGTYIHQSSDGVLAIASDGGINVSLGSSAGNDFNIDSGGFIYEGDNNRVGIGRDPNYHLDVYESSGQAHIMVESGSLASGEETRHAAKGTGNSNTRNASLNVVYYDQSGQAGTNAPVGTIYLQTGDAVNNFLWVDDTDELRISTTDGHRGAGNLGTVVGDQTSDERLKTISDDPFPYGLDAVNKMAPIQYTLKAGDKRNRLGFGAQTMREIVPELVYETGTDIERTGEDPAEGDGKLAMQYIQAIPVLVKSIQELSAKVEALEG